MADEQEEVYSPDVHFEPIVKLPIVEIRTMEENEEVLFQMRAKLFRYEAENSEWKERGTGEIKLLRHTESGSVRILMRRDKTLKICANHLLYPYMELKPNSTSDRAWIWNTLADFADEEPKPELLAIRFGNVENAQKFKAAFEDAVKTLRKITASEDDESDDDDEEDEEKENKDNSLKEDKKEAGDAKEDSENTSQKEQAESKKEISEDASQKEQAENITAKLEELSVKETEEKSKEDTTTT